MNKKIEEVKIMIEICCGSYEDALAAWNGGAGRIELNSALALGGLTPSLGCLKLVKEHTGLKVISMVRPRGAGFCYTDAETEQMFADGEELMKNGSDGLAFGFLTAERTVDGEKTGRMVELIHRFGGEAVFHRAFDCVTDPDAAMEELIRLGVDRVLTSGLREKAPEGAATLKRLQETYGDRVEILAGSGVNSANAAALMEETGITQVHSSCRSWREDVTTSGEWVNYRFAPDPYGDCCDVVSEDLVRKLVEEIK